MNLHQKRVFLLIFFSIRSLPGCFCSLLASCSSKVFYFPCSWPWERKKWSIFPWHVLPFLSPQRTDLSTPAHGVVKKRCGHTWLCVDLRNGLSVFGETGFCFSNLLALIVTGTSEAHVDSTAGQLGCSLTKEMLLSHKAWIFCQTLRCQ